MDGLAGAIFEHMICIDKIVEMGSFTGHNLVDWFEPLLDAMTPDGAVPYLLNGKKERYRASPLASVIISMNSANLLPDMANRIMLDELLFLRDHAVPEDDQKISREKRRKIKLDGHCQREFQYGLQV